MVAGNLQTTLIEEFRMESHSHVENTEPDESEDNTSGFNVRDLSKKGSISGPQHV